MSFSDPEQLTPPILQFENVSFGFTPDKLLFKDIDLNVDMDSRVALVGANGAGKTTLLKLLCGELEPTLGRVCSAIVLGRELTTYIGSHPPKVEVCPLFTALCRST